MKKILSILIMILMCITCMNDIHAVDNTDETNNTEDREVIDTLTTVDEKGNIETADVTDGTVKEDIQAARSSAFSDSSQLVNFNYNYTSGMTTSYTMEVSGGAGYLCGTSAADAAYLGTSGSKVRFMMNGVIGLVDASKVQVVSALKYYESYYINNGGSFYHYICTNVNNNPTSKNYLGSAPSYLTSGVKYYSYDGHYFYTNYDTMTTDYKVGNRNHSINSSSPWYNYFQTLPLRSKTNYTGAQLDSFLTYKKGSNSGSKLTSLGNTFVSYQNTYGVNALIAYATACNESSYGTSSIAKNKNNLFGLSVYDSNTGAGNTYNSAADCVKDFMSNWISTGYLDTSDSRYRGGNVGDKGSGCNVKYASGPYWGETIGSICISIDNYLGSKDKNKYTVAVSDTTPNGASNVAITSSPGGGSTLYRQGSNPSYPVIVLQTTGNYYKVQSDSVLNSSATAIDKTSTGYNYSKDIGYVSKNTFTTISKGQETVEPAITYQGYSQGSGWLSAVTSGTAGTTGQSKILQAYKINLNNGSYSGGISYQAHVGNVGWQAAKTSGQVAGTEGSNQIEAITISLTGNIANSYDIYYRVHASEIGWMGWTKNGAKAGSEGYGFSAEAIEVKLISKGASAPASTSTPFYKDDLSYQTHVSNIGWQNSVVNGATAGTTGKSKAIEAIKIDMPTKYYTGDIVYCSLIQNIGWQSSVKNGALSGTTGKSYRLEAIKIDLTGELAEKYDIYYRVHAQNFGWLDWAKNNDVAGTVGYGYRLEAIEIKLVKKGNNTPTNVSNPSKVNSLEYSTHIQNIGWQSYVKNGGTAGTTGKSLRLEGIKIKLQNLSELKTSGAISYSTHIQNIGWQDYKSNDTLSGTSGRSLRLEAIKIKLTGDIANKYDVYYRVHAQNYGWLGWTKNDAKAGTEGYAYRLEAIEVKLVKKGETAPTTSTAYHKK